MLAPIQSIRREAALPRLDCAAVNGQRLRLATQKDLTTFFQAIPSALLVLNRNRQIIFVNEALLHEIGLSSCKAVSGKRPGEIFNCSHAHAEPGGCGTTGFCRYCGAFNAIVRSYSGGQITQDCHIMLEGNGAEPKALDLRVTVTPMRVNSMPLTVIYAADIKDEVRRNALERVFFHDILNTAGATRGFMELLSEEPLPSRGKRLASTALSAAERMERELLNQSTLVRAERGELAVRPSSADALALLRAAARQYDDNPLSEGVRVRVASAARDFRFRTDVTLLGRVLDNIVKNAVEASSEGDTVTLGCRREGGKALFSVRNPAVMPEAVQKQLFHGSFSTKGPGRGIGTYSIRLLTEGFLHGNVSFVSGPQTGTVFTLALPLDGCAPRRAKLLK